MVNGELSQPYSKFMVRALPLIRKIRQTPASTIEGALCQIEVIDLDNQVCSPGSDEAGEAGRALAVDTIRRCLGHCGASETRASTAE